MDNGKKINIFLYASLCAFFVMSIDFMFMPIGINDFSKNYKAVSIVTGIIFWLGLIAGITLFILYALKCKAQFNQIQKYNDNFGTADNKRIGLISFFSNRVALVSDVVFILSAILFAVLMIFTKRTAYICYIVLSLLVFSFITHCIFNGKIYNSHQKMDEISRN